MSGSRDSATEGENETTSSENQNKFGKFKNEFEVIDVVGAGTFGCVFKARKDNVDYAVKRIHSIQCREDVALKEVSALALTHKHAHIVGYFDWWKEEPPRRWQFKEDEELEEKLNCGREPSNKVHLEGSCDPVFFYIQMELCTQSLREWLKANRSRDPTQIKRWFMQLVSAVAHLHQHRMIHRDLKPGNILIDANNDVKICDFGIVCYRIVRDGKTIDPTRTANKGTEKYMAPEQRTDPYSKEVDIFSLGLILTELYAVMNDKKAEQVFESYRQGRTVNILDDKPDVKEFVALLVNTDPSKRLNCDQILCHEFLYSDSNTEKETPPKGSTRPYDSSYGDSRSSDEEPELRDDSSPEASDEDHASQNHRNAAPTAHQETDEEIGRRILGNPSNHYQYEYRNSDPETRTSHDISQVLQNLARSDDPVNDSFAFIRYELSVAESFFSKWNDLLRITKTS